MSDDKSLDELKQEITRLNKKIEQVDDWANSIYMVLQSALDYLLPECPQAREKLNHQLAMQTEQYEQMERNGQTHTLDGIPLERFEASKKLYRHLELLGVWEKK